MTDTMHIGHLLCMLPSHPEEHMISHFNFFVFFEREKDINK